MSVFAVHWGSGVKPVSSNSSFFGFVKEVVMFFFGGI